MTFEEMLASIEDEELRSSLLAKYNEDSNKEGLYTQKELDRRINAVSQKHITDEKEMREKILAEIEENAKLDAEQKAAKIKAQAEEILKAAKIKENRLNALNQCLEAGMSKDTIESMIDFFVTDDAKITSENITKLIDNHKSMMNQIKKDFMANAPAPQQGDSSDVVTKDQFDKMSMSEQIKFKEEHPDTAKEFMGMS